MTNITFDLALHIYIFIYHPHTVFMAGYDWFEGKVLYFSTQICVYHILFTVWTTDSVEAADFDGIHPILW